MDMGLISHLKTVCHKTLDRVLVLAQFRGMVQAAGNGLEIGGLKEIKREGTGWIHQAHNKNQWQALVNTVMSIVFHKVLGFPSLS
jgi:hypothetical protein